MPTSPPSRCGDPSCGHLATNRGRCDAHQRKAWAGASQHTQLMDSTLKREWRHLVMFTEYGEPRPCAHCGGVAVIADHVVPIGEGGALYDVSNGQPLCQACDDVKTREDLKRMRETRARSK